jgi:hypothetical protein
MELAEACRLALARILSQGPRVGGIKSLHPDHA